MNDVIAILGSLIGAGGLAFIAYFFIKSKSGKGSAVLGAVSQLKQVFKQNEIKQITTDQLIIRKDIQEKEKLSEEKKEQIKNIQKQAAVEVAKILQEDNVEKLTKEIDDQWENI